MSVEEREVFVNSEMKMSVQVGPKTRPLYSRFGPYQRISQRDGVDCPHAREMPSIALMHVTPNGVKCPSGTVKPELRWFFEGNLGKLLGNTKERHKNELRRLRAGKPARASPVPRPRVSIGMAIFSHL